MITIDYDGERAMDEGNADVIVPFDMRKLDDGELIINVFPGARHLARKFCENFIDVPFSQAAIDWLFQNFGDFAEPKGYITDPDSKRAGISYAIQDRAQINSALIVDETVNLSGMENMKNHTDYDLAAALAFGIVSFGMIDNDAIVAMASTNEPFEDGDTWAEIGIETAPAYRGHGLAAMNAAKLADYLFKHGCEEVNFSCYEDNTASVKTAEKVGFKRTGSFYYFAANSKIKR